MSLRQLTLDKFRSLSDGVHQTDHFIFRSGDSTYLAKYGDSDILAEAATQQHFYNLVKSDPSSPRIPKVYDAFEGHDGWYFLVMEYIDAPTLEKWAQLQATEGASALNLAVDLAAPAVGWLLSRKVPNSIFGSISGGAAVAQHRFFKENRAPLPFAHATALTAYVNKALSRCAPPKPPPIDFTAEPLAIYHSDIGITNFLYDGERVCIVNFQYVGAFPVSFQSFALYNRGSKFASTLGRKLGIAHAPDCWKMDRAAAILRQSGDDSLGLDKDGHEAPGLSMGGSDPASLFGGTGLSAWV